MVGNYILYNIFNRLSKMTIIIIYDIDGVLIRYQVSIETTNEAMQPLRGFVVTLSVGMPTAQGKDDFKILAKIVNPGTNNPVDVMEAIKIVTDAKPASRGMLAGFRMIPQGKKLVSLVGEFVAGRADSMKLLSQVQDVKLKAVAFQEAVKSLTPKDGVAQCLDLLALLRPVVNKKTDDAPFTAALKQATEELVKLGGALVEAHVGGEAFTWLSSQTETLQASKIISQPPAFEVLKIAAEFTVLKEDLVSVLDLNKFYTSLGAVASKVDALRHDSGSLSPEDRADKMRSDVVALCQAAQHFQDTKVATFVSCPGLYIPAKKLQDVLTTYLDNQCNLTWKNALSSPLKVVAQFLAWAWDKKTFQKVDMAVLQAGMARVADAKLLATGFGNDKVWADTQMASNFVESMLRLAESVHDDARSEAASVRFAHDVIVAVGLVPHDSPVRSEIASELSKESLKLLACTGAIS